MNKVTRILGRSIAGLAVTVLALLAIGCSSSAPAQPATDAKPAASGQPAFKDKFKDLIEAAKKEGPLVVYEAINEVSMQAFAKEFQARFGIQVEANHNAGAQAYEKYVSEAKAGLWRTDSVSTSEPGFMVDILAQGFVQDYAVSSAATLPQDFILKGGGGIAYPVLQNRTAIAYNADLVKGDDEKFLKEKGWEALTDARWKGKLGLADATKTGSYYALVYMILVEKADRFGEKYVKALAALQPTVFESQTPMVERMAAGEVALGPTVETPVSNMVKKGAPLKVFWPDPTPTTLAHIGLPLKVPHPSGAKLFIEFILSEEGNQIMTNFQGSAGARQGVSADTPMTKTPWWTEPKSSYAIKNVAESNSKKPEILKAWQTALGRK